MRSCKIVIAVLLCSIHNILGELENGKLFDEPVCDNANSTLACNDTLAFDSKYRTYDGKCTNLMHADWGSNNQPFIRLLSAEYEGDLNLGLISRNFAFGSESVDTEQFDKDEEFHLDTHRTAMLGHFGQFIANDITHAFQETFNCNNADSLTCRSDTDRSRADFLPVNGRFLFTRTRSCESNGKREQVNIASAFIDASTVYGSYSLLGEKILRDKDGLLKENSQYRSPKNHPYLPFADMDFLPRGYNQCVNRQVGNLNIPCFIAGDFRANQHLMLTALHTVFLREHNRIARKMKLLNKHWKNDRIFYETRKIIGAIMQRLTYDYYLPEVLGNYGMQQLGNYEGYSEVTNAGVAIEVATAALRFGHTLIPQVLRRLNENYKPFILGDVPIAEALFAPDKLLFDGGIDALIRGAVTSSLMGEILDEETTRTLSPNFRILPLDLISIDVARGKDHGLPPYNAYRIYCGLKEIKSFEEFGDLTENGINSTLFAHSFDNIDNIDLLVGGLLEKPVGGGLVGPTFACLIADQFRRAREGDRLWYERSEVFSADQLKAVKSYSFGKILCNNLDESGLMLENPFVFSLEAPRCFTMEDLNLAAWKDQ